MKLPIGLSKDQMQDWMRQAFQKRLTLTENLQSSEITVTSPAVADTEFTVRHSLGKTPRHYLYNVDGVGTVYDSRRSEWNNQVMYLKCNQPNVTITLTVL